MRSIVLASVLLLRLGLPVVAADTVPEQRVTPIEAASEQRVEGVGGGTEQHIEALGPDELQRVGSAEKGAFRQAAEKTGKVVLGVLALGVSLGFTAASLLLF